MSRTHRTQKKGFTIVELVIVIAVIAILAAVLIPTFAGLIKKANMSVDEQLVKQMNTILATEEITNKPATVAAAVEVMKSNGIANFKANLVGNTFYYVGSDNRVLIWNVEGDTAKVVYPADLADKYATYTEPSADWAKLGDAEGEVEYAVVELEEATVSELYSAFQGISGTESAIIVLPENSTIEADGAYLSAYMKNASGPAKNITLDLNGSTLKNIKNGNGYYYAITVPNGGSLVITNGKLDLPQSGNSQAALSASTGASLILRDVEVNSNGAAIYPTGDASEVVIENSTIKGGGYGVGTNRAEGSNINITIRNSTIEGRSAAFLNTSGHMVIENSTIIGTEHGVVARAGSVDISNSTVKATRTEPGIYAYNNFAPGYEWTPDWQSGATFPSAALVIGCYAKINSYYDDSVVTLTNVKLETPNASVPTVLMAARHAAGSLTLSDDTVVNYDDKIASLTYDDASSVGDIKIYGDDWVDADTTFTHAGEITVNGTKKN